MVRSLALPVALMLTTSSTPALSQSPPPCPAARTQAPAPFTAWRPRPAMLGAMPGVRTLKGDGSARLAVGTPANVGLRPAAQLRFAVPPEKAPDAGTLGGTAGLRITRAGVYRVALGEPAWIDLVAAGRTVPSTAHGHGPDCSGIRKIVDFTLTPGDYVLQLSGTKADVVPVMVAMAR